MYNKTAQIILNSGKASGLSDVYLAQPDSLKENLAGKVFVLAEIGGKASDSRKVFDFLVASLEDNYYNDEKIILRDKIASLKIENIFEAALAKTNKSLAEFLWQHKLRLNSAVTNITLGLIYENKLHFSNFGKNRALLVYGRNDKYSLINVETSAAEASPEKPPTGPTAPLIFSSVISGEIPSGSYFFFTNESLPEYLSEKETLGIISKLPPIVAAEQIKNVLNKINAHVPFLGLIIKNTVGLEGADPREEIMESLSAQNSISSLNHTEQKTEQMLAPAGLINFSKLSKGFGGWLKGMRRPNAGQRRAKIIKPVPETPEKPVLRQPNLDLGRIRSLNYPGSEALPLKDKIFFRKKSYWLKGALIKIFSFQNVIFRANFWSGAWLSLKNIFRALNQKNRLLISLLLIAIVIFGTSLLITNWQQKRQAAENNFNSLVAQITEKENQIDSHLLYNDEAGAKTALQEAMALITSLPRDKKYQTTIYDELSGKLAGLAEKVQKLVKVDGLEKVSALQGLGVNSLVWAAGQLYGASSKTIYSLNAAASSSPARWDITAANNLSNPQFDRKESLYYWDGNQLIKFNIKTNQSEALAITGSLAPDDQLASFKVFNNNLYIIGRKNSQIYLYKRSGSNFGARSDWLKEAADLSQASDLYIDGDIYVLEKSGAVLKFFKGQRQNYSASAILPEMSQAQKIISGDKYIYLFEASSRRLAVLAKKDGHLVNQYQLNSVSQLRDFAIDEAKQQAYFLDETGLYRLQLNQ